MQFGSIIPCSKRMLSCWKSISSIIFIFVISSMPGQSIPDIPIWNFDKLIHCFIYFWLTFIVFLDLTRTAAWISSQTALLFSFMFSISYGGTLEILQRTVFINRSGDWIDLSANTLGAVFAIAVLPYINERIKGKKKSIKVDIH